MIKPTLHHVTIKTSHLDDMIKWYALVVGAKVQFRYGAGAWMTNDDANHRIAFLTGATTACITARSNTPA